jgi:hypothetical protein
LLRPYVYDESTREGTDRVGLESGSMAVMAEETKQGAARSPNSGRGSWLGRWSKGGELPPT